VNRPRWLPTVASYLLREWSRSVAVALAAFVLLYLCIDFFERLPRFLEHDASARQIATVFVLKIPLIVTQMMPAAVLAGTLLGVGGLARRSELMAMRACGISLWQIGTPVAAACLALSIGMVAWNEYVVPPSAARSDYMETVEIKNRTYRAHFQHARIWYHDDRGFTNIDRFDEKRSEIQGLTRYEFDEAFQLRRIVAAAAARWDGHAWAAEEAYQVIVSPDGAVETRPLEAAGLGLHETPEDFTAVYRDPENMSFSDLNAEIRDLSSKGIDTTESRVELWLKLAIPFASLVMALIGLPLASRHSRQASVAANMGAALVVGFSYWVVLALTISLGKGGVLPPALAAWTANVLFTTIGAIFFLGSE